MNALGQFSDKLSSGKKAKSNLRAAKSWYADRYETIRVQRNFLAAVTVIALMATLVSAFSVAELTPSKSVKPFVIQVDDKTGMTQVVNANTIKEIAASEALRQYFVARYVRAREGYDVAFYTEDYNTVRLMSSPDLFSEYKGALAPSNADSPVNVYARHSRKEITIKSLTFIDQNTAQVRIRVDTKGQIENQTPPKHLAVWVSFEFAELDLQQQERYVNPLGFRVLSYRVDPENVQP